MKSLGIFTSLNDYTDLKIQEKIEISTVKMLLNSLIAVSHNSILVYDLQTDHKLSIFDLPHKVILVACSIHIALIITSSGEVWLLGEDIQKAGFFCAKNVFASAAPIKLSWISEYFIINGSISDTHAVVITRAGVLYTWGLGAHGELDARFDTHLNPVKIYDSYIFNISQVVCAKHFTYICTEGGYVHIYGTADYNLPSRTVDGLEKHFVEKIYDSQFGIVCLTDQGTCLLIENFINIIELPSNHPVESIAVCNIGIFGLCMTKKNLLCWSINDDQWSLKVFKLKRGKIESIGSGFRNGISVLGFKTNLFIDQVYVSNYSPSISTSKANLKDKIKFEEIYRKFDKSLNCFRYFGPTKKILDVLNNHFAHGFKAIKSYSHTRIMLKKAYDSISTPNSIAKVIQRLKIMDKSFAFQSILKFSIYNHKPHENLNKIILNTQPAFESGSKIVLILKNLIKNHLGNFLNLLKQTLCTKQQNYKGFMLFSILKRLKNKNKIYSFSLILRYNHSNQFQVLPNAIKNLQVKHLSLIFQKIKTFSTSKWNAKLIKFALFIQSYSEKKKYRYQIKGLNAFKSLCFNKSSYTETDLGKSYVIKPYKLVITPSPDYEDEFESFEEDLTPFPYLSPNCEASEDCYLNCDTTAKSHTMDSDRRSSLSQFQQSLIKKFSDKITKDSKSSVITAKSKQIVNKNLGKLSGSEKRNAYVENIRGKQKTKTSRTKEQFISIISKKKPDEKLISNSVFDENDRKLIKYRNFIGKLLQTLSKLFRKNLSFPFDCMKAYRKVYEKKTIHSPDSNEISPMLTNTSQSPKTQDQIIENKIFRKNLKGHKNETVSNTRKYSTISNRIMDNKSPFNKETRLHTSPPPGFKSIIPALNNPKILQTKGSVNFASTESTGAVWKTKLMSLGLTKFVRVLKIHLKKYAYKKITINK